jgi:hypothetical protein
MPLPVQVAEFMQGIKASQKILEANEEASSHQPQLLKFLVKLVFH